MFAWSRGSTFPKWKEIILSIIPFFLFFFGGGGGGGGVGGDKSLYLKEDISRGYVHHHCIEWFNSPCTEGTIYKDISHNHNQDLMRGLSFNY